jgi:predicted site-specific integrase-resolvase
MNTLNISEAAKYVNRSVKSLQRWDREGRLVPVGRSETNRRVYSKKQLDDFLHVKTTENKVVIYARVSSNAQKPDLNNQINILQSFALQSGFHKYEVLSEIGGGLNFKRKKFNDLMNRIELGEISHLILAHKDRLVRFGFDWFATFCENHDCQLVILNNESVSPQEEMVQDLMTIVHCFSSRLYGLRNYQNKIKDMCKNDSIS